MTCNQTKLSAAAIFASLLFFSIPVFAQTDSSVSLTANDHNRPTTIYFLRNAETQHHVSNETCDAGDCTEKLSDKGLHRANLLATWFLERRVLRTLDAVYTSQKYNTHQTVLPTATLADLDVTQLPIDSTHLNPQATECTTIDAILNTTAGDTILVAADNSTLYNMMGDGNDNCPGLGLLVDNDRSSHRFPKDSNGHVRDYGDVWKVVIRGGNARFVYRVNLETTQLSVIDRAR